MNAEQYDKIMFIYKKLQYETLRSPMNNNLIGPLEIELERYMSLYLGDKHPKVCICRKCRGAK